MAIKKTPMKKVAAGAAVNNENEKKEKTKTRPKGKVKRLKTKSKPKMKKKAKNKTDEKMVKRKSKEDKPKSLSEKRKEKEKLEKEKVNKQKQQPEAKAAAAENYDVRYEKEMEKAKSNAQYVDKIKEILSKKALPPVKVAKTKVVVAPKTQPKESPAFVKTSDVLVSPADASLRPAPKVAKEQPPKAAEDHLDSPTKKLAPDDFCHIFGAKQNVLNGVKMSTEVKAAAAVDPPKIDLSLAECEAMASAEDAPKKVEEIAPADYIQIYSAKDSPLTAGAAPATAVQVLANAASKAVPSTDVLKKAVNENVVNAGMENEKQ